MRCLLLMLCCAVTLPGQATRARVKPPGFKEAFPIEDVSVPFDLDAPLVASFAAVVSAFEELKVPVKVSDNAAGVVGNTTVIAFAQFAGFRLSRVLDCGSKSTGQNADSYRVSIILLALLDAVDASHTKLRVGFVGGGEPPGGAARESVSCSSTGVLEEKMRELVIKHLR